MFINVHALHDVWDFFLETFIFHKDELVYVSGEGEHFLSRMCWFPTEEPSLNSFPVLKGPAAALLLQIT